jgi:hypothetical protein
METEPFTWYCLFWIGMSSERASSLESVTNNHELNQPIENRLTLPHVFSGKQQIAFWTGGFPAFSVRTLSSRTLRSILSLIRPPVSRSRKTFTGDDSDPPLGFTIETYVNKSLAPKLHCRSGEFSLNASTGEGRR